MSVNDVDDCLLIDHHVVTKDINDEFRKKKKDDNDIVDVKHIDQH